MEKLYPREFYLKQLRPFYHDRMIKVITGIRRCGKSSLLISVMNELRNQGIAEKDIVYLNLDKRSLKGIKTADQLDQLIAKYCLHDETMKYLFVDEVQNVKDFEIVLNGFREEGNFSIFITGSNSYLLSGELSTKLTGRYLEFDMFTLSFQEQLEMQYHLTEEKPENLHQAFNEYLTQGGFPQTLFYHAPEEKYRYVRDILQQILQKDVKKRFQIRNYEAFQYVLLYIISNFGAPINLKTITAYLTNTTGITIKPTTLNRYLNYLVQARILYHCKDFDLKSKRSLQQHGKYYLADTSIYFSLNADARINYGPVLENILYVYLTARGYSLSVGRIGKLECDFIARKENKYFYIQVALTIAERTTEEREYRVLETIHDNYPKYLFTLDPLLQSRNGILHRNLLDFIANGEEL